ncbi:MAG: hypothetical protein COB30_001790 [Ectothiorhodospiraceae bacterium]|nr:hypothetical protein [Ectothiorhodospiraceae bacterium]
MKTPHNDKLRSGLNDFYKRKSLSTQRVERMLDQAKAKATSASLPATPPTSLWQRRPMAGLAWAASLFVIVLAGQFVYHQQSLQQNLTTLVLEEIAMNHNKRLDAEYEATRPFLLQTAMQRLDFSLELPADIKQNFQLIGGRYCSIQGGLAAQLKVRNNSSGAVSTLYVTAMTDKLQRIKQQQTAQGRVDIRLWQQQGRFFGLATDRQY